MAWYMGIMLCLCRMRLIFGIRCLMKGRTILFLRKTERGVFSVMDVLLLLVITLRRFEIYLLMILDG